MFGDFKRGIATTMERSPVGHSQSNGEIEQALQRIENQIRTIRSGFEDRLGMVIPARHPVLTWMVEHAADVIRRYQVGDDG